MESGGLSGAVLNGAKEVALEAFIDGQIGFLEMADIVGAVMERLGTGGGATSIEAVYEADHASRSIARELVVSRLSKSMVS